ncbi:Delta-1-pyrroline-5-carboxylate synthase [Stylosanthes scabra]|uniref:Delta-1-pyrroline-5-carboxylate synthase n=1 Tax=Stylosanthes scabra TaxID=79078 RepID=A0ABU6V7N3_9FABA|nr:Delta-1-pyrroline-5-carboxylate synthase [Stylosanthes scabra]
MDPITPDPTRAFVRNIKRVVVKVGTAVVTRSDGRLALGRLGSLCEQLKELNTQGYEVILVTSGAVGLGRQRLRYRRLANSSFADLQKPQGEFDGKACAAVGQSSLMALYDTMFSQLDVTSSQLLVNDGFFRDSGFRKQLSDTVNSLLDLRVIPIFNENDAVSTRKAPYEDSSGIFWDNDSLAGLLALELKADLLEVSARDMAVAARESSRRLQVLNSEERRKILLAVADALEKNESMIRTENEADVAAAEAAGYEKSLISRLTLKSEKISSLVRSVRMLADMEEPIGQILKRTELADKLILEKISCPLGVLLVIFESRPDALVQIAALAIRSGNGLLLKGGKEARRSNAVLHKVITSVMPETVTDKLIGLVTSREEIPDLLKLDDVIDLVVPRGSNKLVSQIKESTKIPVLGHAGNVYI